MDDWRRQHAVFVDAAHTIGAVAVIRSLGRAGYRVIAASAERDALGFYSNHCDKALIAPAFTSEAFVPWMRDTVSRENISLIIPSESFLLGIRSDFAEFVHLLPVPADEPTVYRAFGKWDLCRSMDMAGLRENLPPMLLLDEHDPLPSSADLAALGLPLFIKVDGVHARHDAGGDVVRCETVEKALAKGNEITPENGLILITGSLYLVGEVKKILNN